MAHAIEQDQAGAISRLIVRTTADYTGRGPERVQTVITPHAVFVTMHQTLTKGDQSLVRDGQPSAVLGMRKAYQQTMGPTLIEGVQAITGRKVIAFLSDNHLDPDVAVEVFVLDPDRLDDGEIDDKARLEEENAC